jgi:hypothetical protein
MKVQSQEQYLNLAVQCEAQAAAAGSEHDRANYQRLASRWRQLAAARLPGDTRERHFPPRKLSRNWRLKTGVEQSDR